ncbi:MAG TPA: hypothetical protein VIL19_11215, partial [Casimicrobiaceae bacterium]
MGLPLPVEKTPHSSVGVAFCQNPVAKQAPWANWPHFPCRYPGRMLRYYPAAMPMTRFLVLASTSRYRRKL